MTWAKPERPYPAGRDWVYPTKAKRHTGLAQSRHGSTLYVHRVRGIWLNWNADRSAADLTAGWECRGDGSLDVVLLPEGTPPTCPICVVNERAARMGTAPGRRAVYYARGEDGLIKIGTSLNVGARLYSLDAELIVAEPASGFIDEYRRHCEFAHLRVKGEWFTPALDLLAHMETLGVGS